MSTKNKNYIHNLKVEKYALFSGHSKDFKPKRLHLKWPRETCSSKGAKTYGVLQERAGDGNKRLSSVQPLRRVWLSATPWTAALQASLSTTSSQSLLKLMSIESVMPSNHLILCRPLLLLPSILPRIRVFSSESVLHIRWPKCWKFSFSISPSNEYSGLISFSMDWLDLLAVQGTLKSLLQHHSSKASILRHSTFFIVQLSHPYMTTGKTITLTRWTFLVKVMSLLFSYLGLSLLSFKEQASFNFMAAVTICSDFGAQENKVCHCFHFFPHLFAMKWWDQMPWS